MTAKVIAPGGLILITGVNGYIASHIADQLLSLGYRVRGTARDEKKVATIAVALRKRHPSASFEGFVVSDFTAPGAFDQAMKDCDGVIHVATDVSFDPNPNNVVPQVVQGTQNMLESAEQTDTVKRFVYTSSSIAAVHPTPNTRFRVDSTSWNEIDTKEAWAPPPYLPARAFPVYGASKVAGERACWEFMKTQQPQFTLNTVLPNFAIGPRLDPSQYASTSGWVRGLYNGEPEDTERMRTFPPQYSVDVRDVASTHVSALLESDVQNERLFAFAEPYNYSSIVEMLKEIDPSRQNYPPPLEGEGKDLSTVDNARVIELLQRDGKEGFITLEQSLREQLVK